MGKTKIQIKLLQANQKKNEDLTIHEMTLHWLKPNHFIWDFDIESFSLFS